jgi:hypothetical protein
MTSEKPGLHIRRGMDVYNAFQDRYIGTVVGVWRGDDGARPGARDVEKEGAVENTRQVHEEGQVVGHAAEQGDRMSGEEMGPVPTIGRGNSGPVAQSAANDYATMKRHEQGAGVVYFAVNPGRLNLGPLTRRYYVPTSAVRSISMERIVLGVQQLDEEWRRRPVDR